MQPRVCSGCRVGRGGHRYSVQVPAKIAACLDMCAHEVPGIPMRRWTANRWNLQHGTWAPGCQALEGGSRTGSLNDGAREDEGHQVQEKRSPGDLRQFPRGSTVYRLMDMEAGCSDAHGESWCGSTVDGSTESRQGRRPTKSSRDGQECREDDCYESLACSSCYSGQSRFEGT
jgi:hypothetical protein